MKAGIVVRFGLCCHPSARSSAQHTVSLNKPPPAPSYLCWGCVYLSSSASCRGYLQIFCTGVSRKPSREMSIIFCSSRQASKKYTYLLSLARRESSTQALGWLLQYSE